MALRRLAYTPPTVIHYDWRGRPLDPLCEAILPRRPNFRRVRLTDHMARPKTISYRKLAFQSYAHVCVYCGFGIAAVLEVAHLDCDPSNCGVENLVILCPTCHRMHDIDLIPTDVLIRLRDEKREPNWKKLLKDAGQKALAAKRSQDGLLAEAARKAVATRRARKAAAAKLASGQ